MATSFIVVGVRASDNTFIEVAGSYVESSSAKARAYDLGKRYPCMDYSVKETPHYG